MSEMNNEVPATTPNFTTEAAGKLAELFPEVVADGKINLDTLKKLLDTDVDDAHERFGLTWPGKRDAIRAAQTPTTATLVPDKEDSVDWETTQNVFIEGDNLEVLKILQKHYYGLIKMIYIDPPYNTGKDFVYRDNYTDSIGSYYEQTGQSHNGEKISTNSESIGRFHSNWLNLMYPRLKLARNLLSSDGVIFISIDDSEQSHLKNICDEIFGPSNFVASVIVDGTPKNDPLLVATSHEYVLIYTRDRRQAKEQDWGYPHPLTQELLKLVEGLDYSEAEKRLASFYKEKELTKDNIANYKFVDEQGIYRTGPLDDPQSKGARDSRVNPITGLPLKVPTRGWSCSIDTWNTWIKEGLIEFPSDPNALASKKTYLTTDKLEVGRSVLKMQTRKSTNWLASLFGEKKIFEHPKPVELITYFLKLLNAKDAQVLDFFAGSGTTAEAVARMNADDGGRRRWISVQLPEPTPGNSRARAAGYSNIAEISRERIRRAGTHILKEFTSTSKHAIPPTQKPDVGFKAYKLTDTNFRKWRADSGLSEEGLVDLFTELADSADDHARPEALLTEVLLKLGFSLTEKIETTEIAGLNVFSVADGLVMAYMDEHVQPTLDQLRALVAEEPERLVVLEDAFQGNDELKTNLVQECRAHNVDLWTA